jgi:ParB family chromosome partitioning protein
MNAKPTPPRLGRGLAALFGDMPTQGGTDAAASDMRSLPIDLLDPSPFQPRMNFDEDMLQELADSIRVRGILQPILVRPHPDVKGRYQIIAGERRWRAAAMAEMREIPVICRELDDMESTAAALIENLQRENLNPIEEAEGYQRLIQTYGLTHEALGTLVGKSRAHVGNVVRLLTLPNSVRDEIRKGTLTLGHARAMLTLADPARIIPELVKKGLSVRQTERLVKRLLTNKEPVKAQTDTTQVERDLAAQIGYRVKVATSTRAGGSLTVWFADLFQLDDLISRLTKVRKDRTDNHD